MEEWDRATWVSKEALFTLKGWSGQSFCHFTQSLFLVIVIPCFKNFKQSPTPDRKEWKLLSLVFEKRVAIAWPTPVSAVSSVQPRGLSSLQDSEHFQNRACVSFIDPCPHNKALQRVKTKQISAEIINTLPTSYLCLHCYPSQECLLLHKPYTQALTEFKSQFSFGFISSRVGAFNIMASVIIQVFLGMPLYTCP